MKKIILASTSLQRKEILEKSGIPFIVEASGYVEDMTLPLSPQELVMHLSLGKADTVARRNRNAIIIGADTVVTIEGKVFGKPYTPEKAKEMLTILNGKQNTIVTGVTIIDTETGRKEFFIDETKVYFKSMSESAIDAYIQSGEPLDKAGAYAIQGLGADFIEKIEGDSLNAIGLPLDKVLEIVKSFEI
ncbi:MAG TPA: nucleoside triphosphate pyrophosphatase [Candidatus Saccharimonadales bacterium]|nr:nucleoside triphosphate pyrophosphatase [Candidatus Saccharimonadales bacterium]